MSPTRRRSARKSLLLATLSVVGCSSGCNTQPLTPEQRAFLLGYLQNQQVQYQQQTYQNQQAVQQSWANAINSASQNYYPIIGAEPKRQPQVQQNTYAQYLKVTEEPKLPRAADLGIPTGKLKTGPDGALWQEVKYTNGAIVWVRVN